jgi:hypothetical protein
MFYHIIDVLAERIENYQRRIGLFLLDARSPYRPRLSFGPLPYTTFDIQRYWALLRAVALAAVE